MIRYNLLFSILIGSIINSSIFGINPKLCKDCKHFIKDCDSSLIFAKCSFFEKIEPEPEPENEYLKKKNQIEFLVTGNKVEEEIKPKIYFYCSTARDCEFMCGIEGKKYEPIV